MGCDITEKLLLMMRLAFMAGRESPYDLMDQEVARIIAHHLSVVICPHCNRPLRQHHRDQGTYWSCTCSFATSYISSKLSRKRISCPTCDEEMQMQFTENEFSLRLLLWECPNCNNKVRSRLCPNCFSIMERQKRSLNNFLPFVDVDWYTCFACGKTFEYKN